MTESARRNFSASTQTASTSTRPRFTAGIYSLHDRNENRHLIFILSGRGFYISKYSCRAISVAPLYIVSLYLQIPNVLMILHIVSELKATGIARLETTGFRRMEVGLPAKMCSPCEEDFEGFCKSG